MKDKDFEKEFLLNEKMKELMLDDQETSELDEEYKEQEESENDTRDDVDTTVIIIKKKNKFKLLISLQKNKENNVNFSQFFNASDP